MTTGALYRETGSAVERVDPRAKIAASFTLLVVLLVFPSLWLKGAVVVGLIAVWAASRLGARLLVWVTGSLTVLFVFTVILRAVIRGAEDDRFTVGFVSFSRSGLVDAAQLILQILGIVLALSLLVRTTSPIVLAEGFEKLLRPLQRWLPVHEAVLVFSIAMRFLPLMRREFGRLQVAQVARGAGVHRGGVLMRGRAVLPLLVPMFIVSLVRAKELSEAMDARGYRGAEGRSEIRCYRFTPRDWAIMATPVVLLVIFAVVSVTVGLPD